MEDLDWALSNAIRTARMKKGYTQETLAELLDITPGHLKHMESGKRKPSVPLLFQMMELLDFSVDVLVFPERQDRHILHTNGLNQREADLLSQLADAFRERK